MCIEEITQTLYKLHRLASTLALPLPTPLRIGGGGDRSSLKCANSVFLSTQHPCAIWHNFTCFSIDFTTDNEDARIRLLPDTDRAVGALCHERNVVYEDFERGNENTVEMVVIGLGSADQKYNVTGCSRRAALRVTWICKVKNIWIRLCGPEVQRQLGWCSCSAARDLDVQSYEHIGVTRESEYVKD